MHKTVFDLETERDVSAKLAGLDDSLGKVRPDVDAEFSARLRAVWFPDVCRVLAAAAIPDDKVANVLMRWVDGRRDNVPQLLLMVALPGSWGPYVLRGLVGVTALERGPSMFRTADDPEVFAMWGVALNIVPPGDPLPFGAPYLDPLEALADLEAMANLSREMAGEVGPVN